MQSWRPRTNPFSDFSQLHLSKVLCLPRKSDARFVRSVLHYCCHAKSSSQNWTSDAPKCNPSQEISARTTENASLQILFKWSHACHRFWKCYKTLTFCSLLTRSHNPRLRLPRERTSTPPYTSLTCKSDPNMVGVLNILTSKCASRNFQKWSVRGVSCTFWLRKCASRHNGVQLFISHLPSGLRTHRFSEPTFWPSATKSLEKQCFATFLPFRAPGSSFFWDFLFFDLLSSFSSLRWLFPSLLFICRCCRKFDF